MGRLDGVLGGAGRVVFISGDAGAGKSTLIEAFLERAGSRAPDARVIRALCSEQYGAGEPYQPFVEAFRDLVTAEPAARSKRSLRELAKELAPYWVATLPVAGQLLSAAMSTATELRSGLEVAGGAAPSEEALFFQYTELFFAAAAAQPILLFIDDLHWADRATVALLSHIARKIERERVMIVGTYRAADVHVSGHPIRDAKLELERYRLAEEIALEPLDRGALGELVRLELGAPPSSHLLEWLDGRAGTNPLFFSELLHWLVEQGHAREARGEWRLETVPAEIEVPRSAASTIEKRLTRLDAETYRIVEYASVQGNEFDSVALAALLGADELELEEAMEPLSRVHRLVRMTETRDLPNGDIASIYQFSHSLIQDVLHNNLQGKRRILLHRKMAEILEGVYASDAGPISHRLAVHFDLGRQPERAFDFAVLAADRAARLYAHFDAIDLLRRALRNAQDAERKALALERLGEEEWVVGRFEEALDVLGRARAEAETIGDALRALKLKRKALLVERDHGARPAPELLRWMAALAEEARALGSDVELCHILWNRIDLPGTGEKEDLRLAREALAIAVRSGDNELIAKGRHYLGIAHMMLGASAEAIVEFDEALRLYDELGDLERAGRCHNCIAINNIMRGDYAAAAAAFDGATAAFGKVGNPNMSASVRGNLGVLLTRRGEWERAEENLREAVRIRRRIDASARLISPLQSLAELHQAKRDTEAAEACWQELLQLARETGYWNAEVVALCGLGTIRLERGDVDGARAAETEARGRVEEPETWSDSREALQMLAARLAEHDGDVAEAVRLMDEAEPQLLMHDRFVWATFRLYRGQLVAREDAVRGAAIAREALSAFEALGAEPMGRRASDFLSSLGAVAGEVESARP